MEKIAFYVKIFVVLAMKIIIVPNATQQFSFLINKVLLAILVIKHFVGSVLQILFVLNV